jgi:hypothetical protein
VAELPVWLANTIEIVAFVRDLIFLLILFVGLVALIFIYRKIAQLLEIVKRTARSTEDMVNLISENIAKPAASGSGVAFGLGKIASFLAGFLRRK